MKTSTVWIKTIELNCRVHYCCCCKWWWLCCVDCQTPRPSSRPSSRPGSRHQSRTSTPGPSAQLQDLLERLGRLCEQHDALEIRVEQLEVWPTLIFIVIFQFSNCQLSILYNEYALMKLHWFVYTPSACLKCHRLELGGHWSQCFLKITYVKSTSTGTKYDQFKSIIFINNNLYYYYYLYLYSNL